MKVEENKTIGKIVVFIWFVVLPAVIFYFAPQILCLFFGFIFVFVGIPLLMERFGYQEVKSHNRNDRFSHESWGSGWSDGSYSWDDGYGGDCGGGDGGGDCGGGGDGGDG